MVSTSPQARMAAALGGNAWGSGAPFGEEATSTMFVPAGTRSINRSMSLWRAS